MSLLVENNRAGLWRKMALCFALALVGALAADVRSPSLAQNGNILPPPKSNLVPVHWPDLTNLEPDVREQLTSLQNSLSVTVKNPRTSDTTLAKAYGTMGE